MPMPSRGNPLKGEGGERGCGTFVIKNTPIPSRGNPFKGERGERGCGTFGI